MKQEALVGLFLQLTFEVKPDTFGFFGRLSMLNLFWHAINLSSFGLHCKSLFPPNTWFVFSFSFFPAQTSKYYKVLQWSCHVSFHQLHSLMQTSPGHSMAIFLFYFDGIFHKQSLAIHEGMFTSFNDEILKLNSSCREMIRIQSSTKRDM